MANNLIDVEFTDKDNSIVDPKTSAFIPSNDFVGPILPANASPDASDRINYGFFTGRYHVDAETATWMYWSRADLKATSSAWGGNYSINTRPQWTPMSDHRRAGSYRYTKEQQNRLIFNSIINTGMGRMYSDQVDDEVQRIYFRFGVPQFKALSTFLTNMSDTDMTKFATTGSTSGIIYKVAGIVGRVIMFVKVPKIAIILGAAEAMNKLNTSILWKGNTDFYSLKPLQHAYWSGVQSLVNEFLVRSKIMSNDDVEAIGGVLGAINYVEDEDVTRFNNKRYMSRYRLGDDRLTELSKLMPQIFDENYGLNVTALAATRVARARSRVARRQWLFDDTRSNREISEEYLRRKGIIEDNEPEVETNNALTKLINVAGKSIYYNTSVGKVHGVVESLTADNNIVPGDETVDGGREGADFRDYTDPESRLREERVDASLRDTLSEYFRLEWDLGMEFVGFDVNYTGSIEESFSNTVKPSELGGILKGTSSFARTIRFNLANGSIIGGPIGKGVDFLIESTVSAVSGLINGMTFGLSGSLLDTLRGAQIIIPDYWDDSEATLPAATYQIELRSPSGDIMSQIKNIYIPLFCLMAGALPQSAGNSAYTNPLYCQLFDRGRQQKRLAMISGISIRRGAGSTGFDRYGRALAIDVDIDVVDLSPMVTIPTTPGLIDADENSSKYISMLAAETVEDRIYKTPKTIANINRLMRTYNSTLDKANIANYTSQSLKSLLINSSLFPLHNFMTNKDRPTISTGPDV